MMRFVLGQCLIVLGVLTILAPSVASDWFYQTDFRQFLGFGVIAIGAGLMIVGSLLSLNEVRGHG